MSDNKPTVTTIALTFVHLAELLAQGRVVTLCASPQGFRADCGVITVRDKSLVGVINNLCQAVGDDDARNT